LTGSIEVLVGLNPKLKWKHLKVVGYCPSSASFEYVVQCACGTLGFLSGYETMRNNWGNVRWNGPCSLNNEV
jgi:hypothetical protein